jgi:hypothetical protein
VRREAEEEWESVSSGKLRGCGAKLYGIPAVGKHLMADASTKPKMFISHISEAAEIAGLFKTEIERAFLGLVDVFVSSNAEAIRLGSNWL